MNHTISLINAIENWTEANCKHHLVVGSGYYTYISCCCDPNDRRFGFSINKDFVTVYNHHRVIISEPVQLFAANPNFFDKLSFFLVQGCEARML